MADKSVIKWSPFSHEIHSQWNNTKHLSQLQPKKQIVSQIHILLFHSCHFDRSVTLQSKIIAHLTMLFDKNVVHDPTIHQLNTQQCNRSEQYRVLTDIAFPKSANNKP
jgi:hypothetical protein